MTKNTSEVEAKADFSIIRYAQVWEDADILLAALDIQPNDTCLAIASGGDNSLAMLSKSPKKVIALDLNPAQIYCLELKVSAFKCLSHDELLSLIGSQKHAERDKLYHQCRDHISQDAQTFWDQKLADIIQYGIGGIGKFERYFRLFRQKVLPLIHSDKMIQLLFEERTADERRVFFDNKWHSFRWRLLIRLFFSKFLMGKMGRDPAFFKYIKGSFANHVSQKIQYGMCQLNPRDNPYLQWILTGHHQSALPYALRKENYQAIKDNLDKLEWHLLSIEAFADEYPDQKINKFNLSNIFEYMSEENYHTLLKIIINMSESKARLAYWNMLAPRSAPQSLQGLIQPQTELANTLQSQDKAIFYSKFNIEDVL